MCLEDALTLALKCMNMEKHAYKDYLPDEAIEAGKLIAAFAQHINAESQDLIIDALIKELPTKYPYPTVWWYSVLCNIKKDRDIFFEFIKYIRKKQGAFSANTLYFLYYQLKSNVFVYPQLNGIQIKEELWRLFIDVIRTFEQSVCVSLDQIPYEERNNDLIVVITEQFIRTEHGPTKTALDRCRALIKKEGKKVLLLNTAEVLSEVGEIPFAGTVCARYCEEMQQHTYWDWKGVQVPYTQCDNNMPDVESLKMLLLKIRQLAPEYIISIGGSSVLSNLANKMIPTLTVGLNPSELECTTTTYQTLSGKLTSADTEMLQRLGLNGNHVIEGVFTSSLKQQTQKIERVELGIPENAFLILVVGARLHSEVTDDFLNMLEQIVNENMYVGFAGFFNGFETKIAKHPKLAERASYLGFFNDILALMEVGDLYVNPIRKGGGTSCVEAMYMGLPVVTTAYGDVSVNVGEDFWVNDYPEMQKKIMQYYTDQSYYNEMAQKAKKRTELLLDTEGEFIKILQEVRKREGERA